MISLRTMSLRGGSNGRTTTTTTNKTGQTGKRPSFWFSILFWLFYGACQCYLLKMYHKLYSKNGTTTTTTTTTTITATKNDQLMKAFKGNSNNDGRQQQPNREPDGSFNGYPIYKLENKSNPPKQSKIDKGNDVDFMEKLYSQFHCMGEIWRTPQLHRKSKTYHEQSWMYRSCKFEVFCFDTATKEYVIYLDPEKHVSSRNDHHYHADVPDPKPHPSPHINTILEAQKERLQKEQQQVEDKNHERNTTTTFKHPTFFDDTATVYRNHTVVVDGTGSVVLGDTEQGKQYGVSIGSINAKWGLVDIQLLKWFPEVRWGPIPGSERGGNGNSEYDVYTLPESVVMIPFHSLSAENPGHLVWDDLLPMHTILGMFGFLQNANTNENITAENDTVDLLPIRYHLPGNERGLWASCDWLDSKRESCKKMLGKFGTLMGTRRSYLKYHTEEPEDDNNIKTAASKLPRIPITTNRDVELYLTSEGDPLLGPPPEPNPEQEREKRQMRQSGNDNNGDTERRRLGEEPQQTKSKLSPSSKPKLICARNGLAGFGAISDHVPMKGHGWERWDYYETHNYGRAGQFWEFRNYMIHNLFASTPKTTPTTDIERRWGHYRQGAEEKQASKSVTLTKDQLSLHPPHSITDLGPDEPLVVLLSAYSSQRRGGGMLEEMKDLQDVIREKGGSYQALYGRPPTPGDVGAKVKILPEIHIFSKYSLEAQIQMASRAAVMFTTCGGGAMTAAFLPQGASALIYYSEYGGIENNRRTNLPARLDWDFFNNAGYLHANWLPVSAAEKNKQKRVHTDLMLEQLRRIHGERIKEHQRKQQQTQKQKQ